jgi:hypothetical protein
MTTKFAFQLAALALTSACASNQAPAAGTRPAFSSYRAGATRPFSLTAPYGGYLTQQGPCLGLTIDGRFATIIWPETARLTVDSGGLLLTDERSGARLRLGDYLQGTGGPLPPGARHSIGDDILTETFPVECARWHGYDGWIGIVNPGFRTVSPPSR